MFTRNLLDQPFFSGMKMERYKDNEAEDNSAVPSATRNLLDSLEQQFVLGIKMEPYKREGISRVSTQLKLFDETWVASNRTPQVAVVLDPWKVKKKLEVSDLNVGQTRLLMPSGEVKAHILPLIGATEEQIGNGIDVRVWDCDTRTLHNMKFRRWKSKSYVLKGKWMKEFVKRRKLKEKDIIGLYWDVSEARFHFSVLG